MTPKKKKEKKEYYRKKRLGTWYRVGQVIVILGAILAIVAAILELADVAVGGNVFDSYTFGQLGVAFIGSIIAIVFAILLLWMMLDNRFVYRLHLILFAILIIVIAIIIGNIGGLVCIIGGILIIFEQISKE